MDKEIKIEGEVSKIYYALEHIENKSVVTLPSTEWFNLIRQDGKLTELERLPSELSNPKLQATTIVAVASGSAFVQQPGMEILRYAPDDEPYLINLDCYTVIENFHRHEIYSEILKRTKIDDTPELQWELKNHVYVIKQPPNPDYHWFKDFPEYYLSALKKNDTETHK